MRCLDPVRHAMTPHGGLKRAAFLPSAIRLWRRQAVVEPHAYVVMNDASLLQLCDPHVAHFFLTRAAVMPLAQRIQKTADVLRPPMAFFGVICQREHPDALIFLAQVMQGFGRDTHALLHAGNAGLLVVNLYAFGSQEINSRKT